MVELSELDLLEKLLKEESPTQHESFRRFAEFLTKEDVIPEPIRKIFWVSYSKELPLTNIKREDVSKLVNDFDDAVTAYVMSLPSGAYTFQDEFHLSQLRLKFVVKTMRSVEGFERRMLATQIKQQIFEELEQPKGGIINRIMRFFGRK